MRLETTEQAMREYLDKFGGFTDFYVPYEKPTPPETPVMIIRHVGPEKNPIDTSPNTRQCKACGGEMQHDDHQCEFCGTTYDKMRL